MLRVHSQESISQLAGHVQRCENISCRHWAPPAPEVSALRSRRGPAQSRDKPGLSLGVPPCPPRAQPGSPTVPTTGSAWESHRAHHGLSLGVPPCPPRAQPGSPTVPTPGSAWESHRAHHGLSPGVPPGPPRAGVSRWQQLPSPNTCEGPELEPGQRPAGCFLQFSPLLQATRDETQQVNAELAEQDASDLYRAGEGRWGTEELAFNVVLAKRSYSQLRATFQAYEKVCGKDIEESIKSETSGDLEKAYLTLVSCAKDCPGYFATLLHKSMKGAGTDEETLIRILVTRAESDLPAIKEKFQQMYKKPLAEAVQSDTSGDFRKLLLAILH
uniref:Annexin n=1 Tax=Taeniopygia guttata TaxID=59729 RepID=A0A674GQJ8_TAEGU